MNADFGANRIRHLGGLKVFRRFQFSPCISRILSQSSGESIRIVTRDFMVEAKPGNLSYKVKLGT